MFKVIIYLIITIGIIHYSLYYFNFDFNFENFNYFKKTETRERGRDIEADVDFKTKSSLDNAFITHHTSVIIESINELKKLNECINNGEINTIFS